MCQQNIVTKNNLNLIFQMIQYNGIPRDGIPPLFCDIIDIDL